MSRLSSTGTSFCSRPSLANLIASCFSRAARFLKLSKSAVVRSRRSQFSSARAARSLSSVKLLRGHRRRLNQHQRFGGGGRLGDWRLLFSVHVGFFIGVGFPFHKFNAVRIDYSWLPGNLPIRASN